MDQTILVGRLLIERRCPNDNLDLAERALAFRLRRAKADGYVVAKHEKRVEILRLQQLGELKEAEEPADAT